MSRLAPKGSSRVQLAAALLVAASLGGAQAFITGAGAAPIAAAADTTVATTPTTPATTPSDVSARLQVAKTFSFALGAKLSSTNIKRLATRDLVVVDGEDASAAQIKRIKAKGAIVLGYLSVGTVESWRSWFNLLKDHRLEKLGDWDGERYTDLTSADARTALADTITPELLAKGFDGLFLDNVDMVDIHPEDAAGMLDVVTRIATHVHAGGGILMAQNGDDMIKPLLPQLDAWNREDATGTYDFDKKKYVLSDADSRRSARTTIAALKAAGLIVTTTDYYASPTSAGAKRAVRIACKEGAIPFVGNINLDTVTAKPQHC